MTARHTFTMEDNYDTNDDDNSFHSTRIEMSFEADQLDELVDEFLHYLWHCGFTYVEGIDILKKAT